MTATEKEFMTKKKSIVNENNKIIFRVNDEEKEKLLKARLILSKPMSKIVREAVFEFYLPQKYRDIVG